MKQYEKSENKWNKELISPKKQNKMIYILVNKSGQRGEINHIKNIREKSSKKGRNSISDSPSDDSNSNSLLSIDSS